MEGDFFNEVLPNPIMLLSDQMAVDDRRDCRVVERIVRPALKLADGQVVLLHILVHAGRILSCLLHVSAHVIERVGRVPVADESGGMEVAKDFHLHNEAHVHDHIGSFLVRLIELGERGEERVVVVMGHGDVADLGQDVLPHPSVGYFRVRKATDKAGDLGTLLVVDECADCKRLAPETVGLRVEAEYLFHNFFLFFVS